ncbi:MAG: hypothetical protein HY831_05175 [Candidatus Aenigmarchaeota archaeon]|nr:hypothetical protein [Candidatus Aenigmarchaeota archaeon]
MELPIKFVAIVITVVVVLVAVFFFFNSSKSGNEINSRNIFSEGCIKYCSEITSVNDTNYAISKAESLEGTDFIKACKQLYPEIKYNWQCWNRNCCKFPVYRPL